MRDVCPRMRTRRVGRHVAMIATAVSTMETVQVSIVSFLWEYTARITRKYLVSALWRIESIMVLLGVLTRRNDGAKSERKDAGDTKLLFQR